MLRFTAQDFIAYLRTQKGYQEKKSMGSIEQLASLHWNPGSNNYTIFAEYFKQYTNRNYQGQAWCFMFISTMLVRCIIEHHHTDAADAHIEALLELNSSVLPYNCQVFADKNKPNLQQLPKVGALVLFWTGQKFGHVGLVTSVDSNGLGFTSIEGNTSGLTDVVVPDGGAVVEKHHSYNAKNRFFYLNYQTPDKSLAVDYQILDSKNLRVTAYSLRVRTNPNEDVIGYLRKGYTIRPLKKCFIDGNPWYYIKEPGAQGWVSAKYVEGWVKEMNNRWWYVKPDYSFVVSDWLEIDNKWYYFDRTGYLATEGYVKSKDKEVWYYVNSQGVWEQAKDRYEEPVAQAIWV